MSRRSRQKRLAGVSIAIALALLAFFVLWVLPMIQHNREVARAEAMGAENPEEAAFLSNTLDSLIKQNDGEGILSGKQFDKLVGMRNSDSRATKQVVASILGSSSPENRKEEAIEIAQEMLMDDDWLIQLGALRALRSLDSDLAKQRAAEFLNHPSEPVRILADQYANDKPKSDAMMGAIERALDEDYKN